MSQSMTGLSVRSIASGLRWCAFLSLNKELLTGRGETLTIESAELEQTIANALIAKNEQMNVDKFFVRSQTSREAPHAHNIG